MQKELFPYFPDGFFDGIKQRDKEREPFELRKRIEFLNNQIKGYKGYITRLKKNDTNRKPRN